MSSSIVDAGEGVDHRLELEIVALEHLDAAVGEALRLLQVAGQHGDVAGGHSLQQVLHGSGAQVAGRAGHQILGHITILLFYGLGNSAVGSARGVPARMR